MPPYLLVVESDPDLQRRIGDTLREASYELSTEAEAAWARRSLLVRAPDGIVLDTQLADGSGFAIAEELRRDPDTQKVPIFFVASRYRGASHQAEARRRFAPAEYLTTPLDVDSLLALVLQTVPPSDPGRGRPVPDYPDPCLVDSGQRREKRAVEQEARDITQVGADMRGSLARQAFARVLQRIYGARRSGALLLVREGVKKIVYFSDGYPVSVRSNVLGECLGQILMAHKMISREILEESVRRMKAESRHQGKVLIEMGALSPHSLQRALQAQMEAKLYELFSWRQGEFVFKDDQQAPDDTVRLEKAPAALILDGIRRHYDPERLHAVLDRFSGKYLAPSRDPLRRLQDVTSDPAELRFVAGLDGSQRLEAAFASAGIPLPKARLLVVALAEAGMIEPADAPLAHAGEGAPREAELAGGQDRRGFEELNAVLDVMRAQDHFTALGLGEDASPAEVERAHAALARQYHPDRFRLRPEEIRALALQIFERLGEAQAVLCDPVRRRRYEGQRAQQKAAGHEQDPPSFSPTNAAAERVYFAGVEHLRARRYGEAVRAFRQASAQAPGHASYRGALGWALFRQAPADPQAIAGALRELQRAVEMEPRDPWVRVSLGRFYSETGRSDEAAAELEAALRLKPDLPEIEEEIRRLRGQT